MIPPVSEAFGPHPEGMPEPVRFLPKDRFRHPSRVCLSWGTGPGVSLSLDPRL